MSVEGERLVWRPRAGTFGSIVPVVEPMRRRDLRQVLPIEAQGHPVPWSKSVFESELAQVASGTRYYAVARTPRTGRSAGEVSGYAGLWFVPDPDGDQAHVTNVVVAAAQRRRGIATGLLVHLADVAIARGCVAWTLEVRASSSGAQELYRRFGFAPAGVRAKYYEQREDAIVMWCHDIDGPDYAARLDDLRGTEVVS
ncbi:MAG: ribosomal-protein-alanine acetyltransferase [Actinomycetota bacterium]